MSVEIWVVDKPVSSVLSEEPLQLPQEFQEKIDSHWNRLLEQGACFTDGPLFMVTKVRETARKFCIHTRLTRYAHNVYCNSHPCPPEFHCRSLFVTNLVRTADDKILLGKMGAYTSRPHRLQFPGGSVDPSDLDGKTINLSRGARRELKEKVGIDLDKLSVCSAHKPKYVKWNGNFGVIFEARLTLDAREVEAIFEEHVRRLQESGQQPELEQIFLIPLDGLSRLLTQDNSKIVPFVEQLLELEMSEGDKLSIRNGPDT
jgi:8-oxo-dGTP pyrophosphatase MutT (NUDIX family)